MPPFQTPQFRPLIPPKKPDATAVNDGILTTSADPIAPVGATYQPDPTGPLPGGPAVMPDDGPPKSSTTTGARPGGPVVVDPSTGDPAAPRPAYRPPNTVMPQPTKIGDVHNPASTNNPAQPATNPNPLGTPQPTKPNPVTTPPTNKLPIPPTAITPPTSPVGANLRGDVYTPGADPRLTGAQSATDAAGRAIQSANRGTMQDANEGRYRGIFGDGQLDPSRYGVNPNVGFKGVDPNVGPGESVDAMESARTAKYGQAQDAALDGLNGPSRTELAQKTLADLEAQTDVQRQGAFRKVGQSAAKFGRIGMGDVNAELGSIEGDLQRDLAQKRNELSRSVAEGDIGDRFRRVDATSGLRSRESGIDAGMRGERRTERDYGTGLNERNYNRSSNERDLETALSERNVGRQMGERDTRLGVDTGNQDRQFDRTRAAMDAATSQTDRSVNDTYDKYNAAGTLEDRIYNQGRGNRDEFRTERGHQDADAQQTIENRIKERQLQQEEEEMRLRRAAYQNQAGGR